MKVLVVDDSSTMRRILKNCLIEIGYKDILQASDGIEALNILKNNDNNQDIGLVLADWHMPNMDGFELLQEIKSDETIRSIPVIMVTTQAEKECVVDALKTGASNYVVKPFTPDVIKSKIREVMG